MKKKLTRKNFRFPAKHVISVFMVSVLALLLGMSLMCTSVPVANEYIYIIYYVNQQWVGMRQVWHRGQVWGGD